MEIEERNWMNILDVKEEEESSHINQAYNKFFAKSEKKLEPRHLINLCLTEKLKSYTCCFFHFGKTSGFS